MAALPTGLPETGFVVFFGRSPPYGAAKTGFAFYGAKVAALPTGLPKTGFG